MKFYLFVSLSVSESVEWVCTKFDYPNGTVVRSCEQTYTGTVLFLGPVSRRTQVLYVIFSGLLSRRQRYCSLVRSREQTYRGTVLLCQVLWADVHRYFSRVRFCEQTYTGTFLFSGSLSRRVQIMCLDRPCEQTCAGTVLLSVPVSRYWTLVKSCAQTFPGTVFLSASVSRRMQVLFLAGPVSIRTQVLEPWQVQ